MIELYGILQEQESINAELGLGVDYYKGEPGEQGIPGKDGKTPVKGVDYFTDAEITEIKDEIAEKVQVGAKGEDGKSAYQLAVEAGYEGSEADWLASLKGTDGRNGIDGINGTNGKDGKTPVKGVDYFTTAEINEIEEGAAAKVDLSNYAKTADLSTVATSGSYNDLSGKPSIPSTTGLATETYVDDKIAEIDIPTVPTKVSAFTNDAGYLTEHQSLIEYAKKTDIPAPYTLPTASTSTLGGVKVDGSTITISDGVISSVGGSGGSEPQKYIKDASVSGNTLTLTKKDDTTIDFTPSGGSGGAGVSGYAFSSSQTFTGEDKAHLKEVITGKNIYMSIDGLTVIRMMSIGGNRGFIVANLNGGTDNVVKVYTVTCDSNLNVVSSQFSLMLSYALLGSSNQYAAAITSDNIGDYIKPWNITTDSSDSNLYNAKELVIEFLSNNVSSGRTTFYYNFGDSTLGSDIQRFYAVPWSIDNIGSGYINYNGSSIELNNASSWNIEYICYKT